MLKTIFAVFVCSLLLVACGIALAEVIEPFMQARVKYVHLPPKIIEKIVYIDRVIYEERIVNHYPAPEIKIIERRLMPKWFKSEEELYNWYEENSPAWLLGDGISALPDCEDYAEAQMFQGFRTGRIVIPVPVWNSKIWGQRVLDRWEMHVGSWTWIDGKFYYIEVFPSENPIKRIGRITAD